MRDRYIEATPACPIRSTTAAAPESSSGNTPECKKCTGRVLLKTPFFFGGSTYFAVAILTEESDGTPAQVFEYSGPGCKTSLTLCGAGTRVHVSLMRDKPGAFWYVADMQIVYDTERAKASLDNRSA